MDMSGSPWKEDLYIGCILMNEAYIGQFINEFYEEFPNLKGFNKKACNMDEEKLKKVIEFMDSKRIRMVCLKFHKSKLAKYFKDIEERKNRFNIHKKAEIYNFTAKLLSILYYYSIKPYAYKNWHYGVEMCIESHLRILDIMTGISNLSHRDGYLLHPRINFRRIQHMLKFADFVAGAGRKVDEGILKTFKYLDYRLPEIETYDSDNLFGIVD